ncbi:MAG: hypothetical protein GEU92_09700 [Alphaproteobacteria bacterium]|nr:hypothetical protein [Alphaproteobacteria bacterium]
MITAREASAGLYGAWRLARLDAGGVGHFENTVEGFWRSFYAALIVLPAYIILVLLRLADNPPEVGPLSVLAIHAIAYVAGWFALPFAMYYVTGWFDRREYYFRYICAYNWASVLQIAVFLLITAIAASGALPAGTAMAATLAATLAILVYQGFIARVTLGVPVGGAIGIVVLDLVISLILNGYTNGLLHPKM